MATPGSDATATDEQLTPYGAWGRLGTPLPPRKGSLVTSASRSNSEQLTPYVFSSSPLSRQLYHLALFFSSFG